jgi:L-lactate dehydrogenase (cytochrome)
LLRRARDAGYQALCLTVDVPVVGRRDRDERNGMTVPPRFRLGLVLEAARHFRWTFDFLRTGRKLTMANVVQEMGGAATDVKSAARWFHELASPRLDWAEVEWCRKEWSGPLLIKGILRGEDARRAVEAGAEGVIVSNHGGRQLDYAPASLAALPEVVRAVGGSADVLFDGGIRRGSDVVKALALGAKACLIGRPYLYGLAARGQQGVEEIISLLRSELDRCLALLGCASVMALDSDFVRRRKTSDPRDPIDEESQEGWLTR